MSVLFLVLFTIFCWGRDRTPLEHGEYVARASDCISCHTKPGGKPYAGGLTIRTPFGNLVTPNITPDIETGIGAWTRDDFYRALHEGTGRNGEPLYPGLPYCFYTKMYQSDVFALYNYLRTIEPVKNKVEVNDLRFPYSLRSSLIGWKVLYFKKGTFFPDPKKSALWNRGAYLVEGPGHCGACHSPRNSAGGIEWSRSLQGGVVESWTAPDITPNPKTAVSDWTVEDFVEFFRTGVAPGGQAAVGPMAEVIDNSLKYLTPEDLTGIAIYLKSLPIDETSEVSDLKRGKKLFLQNCAGCHHPLGVGRPELAPPLVDNSALTLDDSSNLFNVIVFGVPEQHGYMAMPPFGHRLADSEIVLLASFLKTRWGNGKEVSLDELKEWRKK